MIRLTLILLLCCTSFSADESYSEIVFENTPIGAIQSKFNRMKALWNKKNKKPNNIDLKKKEKGTDTDLAKTTVSSDVKQYPKLKYKKYDSFQLDYATSYSDSSDIGLYFYGGYINSSLDDQPSHKRLRIFEYLTKSWSSIVVPFEYRVGASVSYFNNKLYIYGGRPYKLGTSTASNPNVRLNDLLIYDMSLKTWTKLNVGTARSDHSASVYKDKIYFYGGNADPKADQAMLALEILDTSNNQIVSTNYSSNRVFHRSLIFNDKLYIIGGSIQSPDNYLIDVDTIEYLDLKTGEKDTIDQGFSVTHPVVCSYDNKIVVLGGYRGVRSDKTFKVSSYSTLDDHWQHKTYSVNDLNIVVGGVNKLKAYLFGSQDGINSIFRLDLKKMLR